MYTSRVEFETVHQWAAVCSDITHDLILHTNREESQRRRV